MAVVIQVCNILLTCMPCNDKMNIVLDRGAKIISSKKQATVCRIFCKRVFRRRKLSAVVCFLGAALKELQLSSAL